MSIKWPVRSVSVFDPSHRVYDEVTHLLAHSTRIELISCGVKWIALSEWNCKRSWITWNAINLLSTAGTGLKAETEAEAKREMQECSRDSATNSQLTLDRLSIWRECERITKWMALIVTILSLMAARKTERHTHTPTINIIMMKSCNKSINCFWLNKQNLHIICRNLHISFALRSPSLSLRHFKFTLNLVMYVIMLLVLYWKCQKELFTGLTFNPMELEVVWKSSRAALRGYNPLAGSDLFIWAVAGDKQFKINSHFLSHPGDIHVMFRPRDADDSSFDCILMVIWIFAC